MFQSTHPYRVWHSIPQYVQHWCRFNPHTHTGCDLDCFVFHLLDVEFQSTHPYRVWPWLLRLPSARCWVSIHTPIQGVTCVAFPSCLILVVSIHTPIQGVTQSEMARVGSRYVSIHTPIQGVTIPKSVYWSIMQFQSTHPYRVWPKMLRQRDGLHTSFNPHTHTGCDFAFRYFCHGLFGFNPHTHTGCDSPSLILSVWIPCFNPHTHTGCDLGYWSSCRYDWCFNPLTHTGCDRFLQYFIDRKSRFNPHTHTGCDQTPLLFGIAQKVSIHTPIQGVTWVTGLPADMIDVSIHTPIQGVTLPFGTFAMVSSVSIHTPIQGVTFYSTMILFRQTLFQSTHPYRVWPVAI